MEHYALIIGVISDLGLAYAKWFVGRRYNLIMTGGREEVIERRAQEIRNKCACKVIVILVDLVSEGGIRKPPALPENRKIHVLVNNTDFGFRIPLSDTDIDKLKHLIYLQTTVVAEITHHILKGMKERDKGITINISSNGAFAVMPGNATYAVSKRFIAVSTEGFHTELIGMEIKIQAVCPGFMGAGFHENNGVYVDGTRKGVFGFRQPEDVVDEAMRRFEKGKVICILDKAGKLVKAVAEYISKRICYRFINDFVNKNIRKN